MDETLLAAAVDWSSQKVDFERDGSLRDIYVLDATIDDWKRVVAVILGGDFRALLRCDGAQVRWPTDFETLFDGSGHFMSFTVGAVVLTCYFFARTEIELSFAPNDVTQNSLRALLAFMCELGDATKKSVIMTPENCRQSPIFVYDFAEHHLRWCPPAR